MREIRTSGSEGGAGLIPRSYLYRLADEGLEGVLVEDGDTEFLCLIAL